MPYIHSFSRIACWTDAYRTLGAAGDGVLQDSHCALLPCLLLLLPWTAQSNNQQTKFAVVQQVDHHSNCVQIMIDNHPVFSKMCVQLLIHGVPTLQVPGDCG